MKNRIGAPVDGEDFFGREEEIKYVWGMLMDGNNILLPSPRRVGKTSFAKKMLEIAKKNNWETVEINLEKAHSEFEFVELLAAELRKLSDWEKAKEAGNKLFDIIKSLKLAVNVGGAEVSLAWQGEKSDINQELEKLLPYNHDTLIFFDEVVVLLSNLLRANNGDKQHVEEMLHWLRSLRQTTGSKIRWIFSSSVGIENFASWHQLSSTLNDFTPYELESFDSDSAKAMILALEKGAGINLNDEIREGMIGKLGYLLPYFIQVLFERIKWRIKTGGAELGIDLVTKAYNDITEGSYLNTWEERLKVQYNENTETAFLLLNQICQAKEGVKRGNLLDVVYKKHQDIDKAESVLAILIRMLKNDGYLIEKENLYLFRSPLIRDFWYNRFVK